MPVNFTPLTSESGFKSPNFSVNSSGQLTLTANAQITGNLQVTGIIFADALSFGSESNSIQIVDKVGDEFVLAPDITTSSLKKLGILENLEIEGDFFVGRSSTTYMQVDDGTIRINSLERGGIQNMDIGTVIPADGAFLQVDIGTDDSTGGRLGVIGNVFVTDGDITVTNGDVISDNLIANNTPVALNHLTRKDYVDARISAFSIAFGA